MSDSIAVKKILRHPLTYNKMVTVSETCSLRADLLHVSSPAITAMSEYGQATQSKVK